MLGEITLGGIATGVAFLVAFITGVAFLHNNIKKAIVAAVRPELDELKDNVKYIKNRLDEIDDEQGRCRADSSRRHILRFNDELLRHERHSKEAFDNILGDIDFYEDFSATHPTYPNNKAILAIQNIKSCYTKCQQEGTFLQ